MIHAGVAVVTVDEGGRAVLDCNATGNPTPTVSWFQSSLPVPIPGDTRIRQASNDSLIVANVSAEDGGVYVCEASNIAGSETATLELVVNGKWTSYILSKAVELYVCRCVGRRARDLTHETQLTLLQSLSLISTYNWTLKCPV